MKFKILLSALSIAAILSSCSTAYKNGQTPDDVYYSPANETEKYISREKETYTRRTDPEERQLRMRARDYRWRYLDYDYDYGCSYSPYYYGYNHGYYYNPYYYPVPVYSYGYAVVNPKNNAPRTTNLSSYNNTASVKNTKAGYRTSTVNSTGAYTDYNRNSNTEYSRRILRPQQTGNDGSNQSARESNNNTRTYTPSSSNSSSSSSGSSSGGTTVTRPSRGN